jgi:hypothetical protein
VAFGCDSVAAPPAFFLPGYHAHRLSDNLINPIAPLALFRYFCLPALIAHRRVSRRRHLDRTIC